MARTWDCACCGGPTGNFRQFWNQDDEYGLCVNCATWIAGKEGWESVFRCYGKPGVNFEAPVFTTPEEKAAYDEAYAKAFGT